MISFQIAELAIEASQQIIPPNGEWKCAMNWFSLRKVHLENQTKIVIKIYLQKTVFYREKNNIRIDID